MQASTKAGAGSLASAARWDPLGDPAKEIRTPSRQCLRRVHSDLRSLVRDPIDGIFCLPDEEVATVVHGLITGPMDTPYEGGFFYFLLDCPDDYPQAPPKVRNMTTGGGRVRFNPNLYANGKVCLSILGTWSGPGWMPVNNIGSVLLSIQSLLNERPLTNEPGYERPSSEADVADYNNVVAHETVRVAVLDMVGDTTMHRSLPAPFQRLVREMFLDYHDMYEGRIDDSIHADGQAMRDIFDSRRGRFQWRALRTALQQTRGQVEAVIGKRLSDDEDEENDEDAFDDGDGDMGDDSSDGKGEESKSGTDDSSVATSVTPTS